MTQPQDNNPATANGAQNTNDNAQATPPQINAEEEIRIFLEQLLKDSNINLPDEKTKQEVVESLYDRLDRFIAAKIVENLKEDDIEAFIKLNEEGKPQEEIDKFIKEHIPNSQEIFAKAFIDFRDFYLTGAQTFEEPPTAQTNPS